MSTIFIKPNGSFTAIHWCEMTTNRSALRILRALGPDFWSPNCFELRNVCGTTRLVQNVQGWGSNHTRLYIYILCWKALSSAKNQHEVQFSSTCYLAIWLRVFGQSIFFHWSVYCSVKLDPLTATLTPSSGHSLFALTDESQEQYQLEIQLCSQMVLYKHHLFLEWSWKVGNWLIQIDERSVQQMLAHIGEHASIPLDPILELDCLKKNATK